MNDDTIPWWATRYEQMAAIDPLFAGAVDQVAEAQVDLIERLAGLQGAELVLDLGCGAGRHVILLQERGYQATGVDLSPPIIDLARDSWNRRHPNHAGPTLRVGDMRDPPVEGAFDLVILMDAALGVFEDDADHLRTLSAAAGRLRDGGRLIVELLNPYFWAWQQPTRHYPPGALAEEADLVRSYRFDPTRGRLEDRVVVFRGGRRTELPTQSLRAWTPPEIVSLVRAAGLRDPQVYGSAGFSAPGEPQPLDARSSAFLWLVAHL